MRSSSKLFRLQSVAVLFASAALCAPGAFAQNNEPPPSGSILDLAGQTVNHGAAVTESVNFTAALTNTDITFAFREDPAFISFSDVSLTNLTTGSSTNLILNGNFTSGTGSSATDWQYANVYGAIAGGEVSTSCGGGLATCWFDGAVQAYDAIDQFVSTIVGDTYHLSYQYSDDGGLTTFRDISNNGEPSTAGDGIDILTYAQAGLPPPGGVTPEPNSIWLMGTGILLLGAFFYSKRRNGFGDSF